jgi:hypothetical protein
MGDVVPGESFDPGQGRQLGRKRFDESIETVRRPFKMDFDAASVVLHPTPQAEPAGESKNIRAESYALDDSEDLDPQSRTAR